METLLKCVSKASSRTIFELFCDVSSLLSLHPNQSNIPSKMICLHSLNFVLFAFFTLTNAIPFHRLRVTSETSNPGRLAKRTNPKIGEAIDVNDAARGGKLVPRHGLPTTGAFSNAQQLLTYALFDSGVLSFQNDVLNTS